MYTQTCLISFNFVSTESVPNYSKLTLTQAKRLEMESQVRKIVIYNANLSDEYKATFETLRREVTVRQ